MKRQHSPPLALSWSVLVIIITTINYFHHGKVAAEAAVAPAVQNNQEPVAASQLSPPTVLWSLGESVESTADEWSDPRDQLIIGAAAEKVTNHPSDVILLSGGADTKRSIGYVIAKEPLPVSTFTIELDFKVTPVSGPPGTQTATQGFALWYLFDEKIQASSGDKSLFGNQSNFTGLGVFFATYDRSKALRPSISAAIADGTKNWTLVPSQDGIYYDFRTPEVKGQPASVKFSLEISEENTTITGKLKKGDSGSWVKAFQVSE